MIAGLTATGRGRELLMFECFYHPADKFGNPVPMPSGQLPSVFVAAVDRDEAASKAFRMVHAPITETHRLLDVPVPKPPRKKRQPKPKLEALGLVTAASLLAKSNGGDL